MSGFCPDDWHQTTDRDIEQMRWGEDFWMYYPGLSFDGPVRRNVPLCADRKREYACHDAAITQAKLEGLTFHLLPDAEQHARLTTAEANYDRARAAISLAGEGLSRG